VWLGQETCVALGKVFKKIEVQLPHKLLVLHIFFALVGQVYDKKINSKAKDVFLTFVHIM